MKTKKWMAAGLSAVLAVSMFSGCGNSSEVDVGTMTSEEIAKFEQDTGGLKLPLDKKRDNPYYSLRYGQRQQ